MKKFRLLLSIALSAISLQLFAQESTDVDGLSQQGLILVGRFSTSDDLSFKNRSVRLFEIRDSLDLFIGMEEDTNGNINLRYLRIEARDYPSFESNMAVVNEKYAQWTETAKTEGVKNFRKTMPVDFANMVGKFSMGFSSEWVGTKFYAVFEVDEDGDCTLRLDDIEEYDSRSSDYYSQMHTPFFVFHSPKSLDALYQIIKFSNAKEQYTIVKAKVEKKKKAIEDRDAMFN